MNLRIYNGTALVGTDLEATAISSLSIANGRITAIVPAGRESSGEAKTRISESDIDASGMFLVPGLIDSHVHFSLAGTANPFDGWVDPPERRSLIAFLNGLRGLNHGITTVRDLGCPDLSIIRYQEFVEEGAFLGPSCAAAGRPITATGGHVWKYSRQADGADDVRKAVREQVRDGARWIKIMATGGFATATDPRSAAFSEPEITAAVAEAHMRGLRVAVHAHSPTAIEYAINAGVDSIEHAALATPECLDAMAEADIPLVPTLHAVVAAGTDNGILGKDAGERVSRFRDTVRTAIERGVRIVAGTDAGTQNNPIGNGLLFELGEYITLGMSCRAALASVTVSGGQLLGGKTGVLGTGYAGDVLVVDKDPTVDIDALHRIRHVVKGGVLVDRTAINSIAPCLAPL